MDISENRYITHSLNNLFLPIYCYIVAKQNIDILKTSYALETMRLQGLAFRLLAYGICAVYIWYKGLILIFPALMALLTSHAYYRLKDDLTPQAELGAEKHE